MVRRAYAGGAVPTTLASGINTLAVSATLVALSGYPSGSSKWYAVIDKGEPTEEKVLVTNVSGFIVTITRGQDGTTAQDHSAGATFEHCYTATDADEANRHANATGEEHGLPVGSEFVGTTGAQTLEDKTLDCDPAGGANIIQNLPTTSSPAIMAAIAAVQAEVDAVEGVVAAGDADRWTKAEADSRYIQAGGDTMTGTLVLHTSSPSASLHAASKGYVDKWVPIGTVIMWAYSATGAPSGWLNCDGSAVSRTTYAALFAVLGEAYGPGDGVNTFNLPNFAGFFPRGTGVGPSLNTIDPGDNGGGEAATILEANLPAHTHDIAHEHGILYGGGSGGSTRRLVSTADFTSSANLAGQTSITPDATSGSTGGGSDLDIMNPWLGINFMIRATA